jgi:hypothetical protein
VANSVPAKWFVLLEVLQTATTALVLNAVYNEQRHFSGKNVQRLHNV